jgi:hypothetical protein
MATNFINAVASNIGTTEVVIYTAPANTKAILIGCNLANTTGSILPVSLILRKTTGDTYIVKNKRVDNGDSSEVMKGNKIILLPTDQLVAISVDDDAFDAIASILTGVA